MIMKCSQLTKGYFPSSVLKATLPERSCTKLDITLQMLTKQHPSEVARAYYLKKEVGIKEINYLV